VKPGTRKFPLEKVPSVYYLDTIEGVSEEYVVGYKLSKLYNVPLENIDGPSAFSSLYIKWVTNQYVLWYD